MGERVGLTAKKPEVNRYNSNSRMRRTDHPQSVNPSVDRILFLQRTVGNQAVQRLLRSGALQAKLRIGQPGDVYEQEADRVADEVMRMPEPGVQRQFEPEEEEEEILQTKPLVDQITPLVQRQVEEEEEEEMLQAKSGEDATSEVSNGLESQINAIKGGGRPLAESERAYFEPRFGHDFREVRVHTNAQAEETARAVNARAFTVGQDVVFGEGQYSPQTSSGKKLLAHELTHVIQQSESIPTQTARPREANAELKSKVISLNKFDSVPHIQKYGFNVHFTETKNWAKAYFSEEEAHTIAREDQNLDMGDSHPTATSLDVFRHPERNDQYTLHFPSRSVAESGVRNAILKNNLSTFGRALHRYQDSFSHNFPRGAPYNNISNARHDIATERAVILLARSIRLVNNAQLLFPNTRFGRGAIIRHLNLGNYPDDYNVNGQQRQRDRDMKHGSIAWIEEFHLSRTSP